VCLNSHPSSMKETDCCPLISRTPPVIPYSSIVVTHISPLNMLGCSFNTLEPVSKIRLLDIPSVSTEIMVCHAPTKWKPYTLQQHCQEHSGGRSCLHSHLFLISLLFCFPSYSLFHSVWGLSPGKSEHAH
jgi:hypothetical protein